MSFVQIMGCLVVLMISLFFGCSNEKNGTCAITVNGIKISRQEVDQAAGLIQKGLMNAFPEKDLQGISAQLIKDAARQLIANELMIQEAGKQKISFDTSIVDSAFERFRNRFGDQATFEREVTLLGQSAEGIRREMEKGALLDAFIKELMNRNDSVTTKECRDYYAQNSSKYTSSSRMKASQIFFPLSSSADESSRESTRKKADAVLSQIRGGGVFEKLANKHSSGPEATSDGDIGWFRRGDLRPELEQALTDLRVGEVSDVLTTEAGFHILKKTDEETGKQLSYEEVQEHIRTMIDLKKKNTQITGIIDSLISKAKISYHDTSLVPSEEHSLSELLQP